MIHSVVLFPRPVSFTLISLHPVVPKPQTDLIEYGAMPVHDCLFYKGRDIMNRDLLAECQAKSVHDK